MNELPVWKGCRQGGYAFDNGDYFGATIGMLDGTMDAFTLGEFTEGKIVISNGLKLTSGYFEKAGKYILTGGKTFEEYKKLRGGTKTLDKIKTSTGTQRISTEFHHWLITQRMQRKFNLPNWLVNNRFNVIKLNTIQHSIIDRFRKQFLRAGIKNEVGWFKKYNWFSKF